MAVDKLLKELIKSNLLSENSIFDAISTNLSTITRKNYYTLVSLCQRSHIDINSFFESIYSKMPEDIQYLMWKEGYVNSCPANQLLSDLTSESEDIIRIINSDYNEYLPSCEAYFSGIQDIIIEYLQKARNSIRIAMAWFTNPLLFNALLRVCRKGVSVKILINNDLINNRVNGLPFNKLIEAGADLYIAEPPTLIHNKFCIIDDNIVIDGSYNWTILAEKNNDENIVVLKYGKVVKSFISAFNSLIRNNKLVDQMPQYVPEKLEYDCCSYKYYNSEEWLETASKSTNKRKQKELYKEVFKLLSEDESEERLPSDMYKIIQAEIKEEKERDTKLFSSNIDSKADEISKHISANEVKISTITTKVEKLNERKEQVIEQYKSKIASLRSSSMLEERKSAKIEEIKARHKSELRKLNRNISAQTQELETYSSESRLLVEKHDFITSLRESDLKGANGLCRVNLQWNTKDDLDLHLILPNGNMDSKNDVYYSNMQVEYNGSICSLDHDAIPETENEHPQENIIWENSLPNGDYKIRVKLFSKKSDKAIIPFSITIFTGDKSQTEVFYFENANSNEYIDITTLTFLNGKVVTPIRFTKDE